MAEILLLAKSFQHGFHGSIKRPATEDTEPTLQKLPRSRDDHEERYIARHASSDTVGGGCVRARRHAPSDWFLLLSRGIELYRRGYPAWRHLVMAAIDCLIAWIAIRRTPFLTYVLIAFAIEQVLVNGVGSVAVLVFVAAVVVAWQQKTSSIA